MIRIYRSKKDLRPNCIQGDTENQPQTGLMFTVRFLRKHLEGFVETN